MSALTIAHTDTASNPQTYYAIYAGTVEGRATRLDDSRFLFQPDGATEPGSGVTLPANDPELHLAGLCALADAQRAADQESDRQAHPLHAAVQAVADRARASLGEASHGRIEKAVAIVLSGGVHLNDDGHSAYVDSQSTPLASYAVNGSCACPDAPRAPMGLCKHRIAAHMLRRVLELTTPLEETPEDMPAYTPQEVATVAQEALCLPEAPCSVNARVLVHGLEVQITGRGFTGAEAAANFKAALAAMQA